MSSYASEITAISKVMVIIKAGRTVAGLSFGKLVTQVDVLGQEAMEAFWDSRDLISGMYDLELGVFSDDVVQIQRSTSNQPL